MPGHGSMSPVDIIGSTAAIVKCTFAGNFIASETEGVIRGDPGSIVVLQTPIFTNNAGPGQLLLGDHGMMGNRTSALRTIFSDDAEVTNYCQDGTAIVSMLGPGQEPPDARSELGSMEEWLRGSRSVRIPTMDFDGNSRAGVDMQPKRPDVGSSALAVNSSVNNVHSCMCTSTPGLSRISNGIRARFTAKLTLAATPRLTVR